MIITMRVAYLLSDSFIIKSRKGKRSRHLMIFDWLAAGLSIWMSMLVPIWKKTKFVILRKIFQLRSITARQYMPLSTIISSWNPQRALRLETNPSVFSCWMYRHATFILTLTAYKQTHLFLNVAQFTSHDSVLLIII